MCTHAGRLVHVRMCYCSRPCNISEKRVNSNSDQLQRRKTRTQQHKDILMHMTTEDRTESETRMIASVLKHDPDI